MQRTVNFKYLDNNYIINIYDSLLTMLTREELVKLPLEAWEKLFILKDGVCVPHLLLKVLEEKIKAFDKESNSVIYNNVKYKINKVDRISLTNLVNSNPDTFNLILGENVIFMPVEEAKSFLLKLEKLSAKCFYVTYTHLLNIKNLRTIEDIINYDYTQNYPSNIILQ